jgi:Ras-related protein Rab-1A
MDDNEPTETIKLMIIGDQAVGKSSILIRYTEDTFTQNMIGTAGVDYKKKVVEIENKLIKVIIYDTAGHERFQKITKNFYNGAKGIILVYSVNEKKSFDNLQKWVETIQINADTECEVMLVGNKIDLDRNVSSDDGTKVSTDYKTHFIETSAKTGENIDNAFSILLKAIVNKETKRVSTEKYILEENIKIDKVETKKKKCCSSE